MNTNRKENQFENEATPTEQLKIYWTGSSLLLRRVVSILENNLLSISNMKKVSFVNLSEGFIIHDGSLPPKMAERFRLDFNISHFGNSSEEIAKNLVNRMGSGLV